MGNTGLMKTTIDFKPNKISHWQFWEEGLSKLQGNAIYIYGAGSFGKEVFIFLQQYGIAVCGFLDQRAEELIKYCSVPVYNLDDNTIDKQNAVVLFAIVMDKDARIGVMNQIRSAGFDSIQEAQYYRSLQVVPENFQGEELDTYYLHEQSAIEKAYEALADDKSKAVFMANLNAYFRKDYRDCVDWEDPMAEQYFPKDIKMNAGYGRFVDCGGYIGDTVEALLKQKKDVQALAVFEPDLYNFERLAEACRSQKIEAVSFPCAVSDKTEFHGFCAARGSGSLSEDGDSTILSVALDDVIHHFNPTFIKMDIEGAEVKALQGAKQIICQNIPDLAICVYHNMNHMWDIPLLLQSWNLGYRFYLRSYNAYTMETVLYATKGES